MNPVVLLFPRLLSFEDDWSDRKWCSSPADRVCGQRLWPQRLLTPTEIPNIILLFVTVLCCQKSCSFLCIPFFFWSTSEDVVDSNFKWLYWLNSIECRICSPLSCILLPSWGCKVEVIFFCASSSFFFSSFLSVKSVVARVSFSHPTDLFTRRRSSLLTQVYSLFCLSFRFPWLRKLQCKSTDR